LREFRLSSTKPSGKQPASFGIYWAKEADLVSRIRASAKPGLMEVFLAEYGLSTDEGIALMCLAEALLRVPDAETMDALIEDKIAPSDWGKHLGNRPQSLVNASTWALDADRQGAGRRSGRHRRHAARRRPPLWASR
jgi:RHH-type proline utilization regulon transcriptional repressor/proline dehydrogenase/delta 1-pyrroline-5-carboxylate dehydrogenase